MKKPERLCLLTAVLLMPVAALAGEAVYKSVDEAGQVTYSAEPPADAAEVETVQLPAEPSEAATKEALKRAKDMEQEVDSRNDAIMERRQQEADAQRKAQEEAQSAELQRGEEEEEESDWESRSYIWNRRDGIGPTPPRPPRPPNPPRPPRPPIPLGTR